MDGFVYMTHPVTGGSTWTPDRPGVVAHHEARGWVVSAEPVDADLAIPGPEPDAEPAAADDTDEGVSQ